MKQFILCGALALVAFSLAASTASAASCRHPARHAHFWTSPVAASAAYARWDHPYYRYAPYSARKGVLVHEAVSVGPIPRGGLIVD